MRIEKHREEELAQLEREKPVVTNPNFWDCECVENYIHPKERAVCVKCGTPMIDRTDSRANEVAILKREENA
tara:strand:+ start:516 stop:731 length:216 start_codon:yes stop_codon:yes gene_type:complete